MRPYYTTRLREQLQGPPDTSRKGYAQPTAKSKDQNEVHVEVNEEYSIKCEELRKYVLRGGFHVSSDNVVKFTDKFAHNENLLSRNECYMKLWIPPRSRLSIFLSSTWNDVPVERHLLLQKIYPKLASVGKQSRLKVLE